MSAVLPAADDTHYKALYLDLKALKQRDDIDYEQAVLSYQAQLETLQVEARAARDSERLLRDQLDSLNRSTSTLSTALSNAQIERQEADSIARKLQIQLDSIQLEKRDVLKVSERHLEIDERKNAEYEELLDKYQSTRTQLNTALTELSQAKIRASTSEFKTQNLEREVDLIRKQCVYFESQYRARTDEIASLRKDKSSEIFELKDRVGALSSEVDIKTARLISVEKLVEELTQRQQQALQDLTEAKSELVLKEEQFKKEISIREQAVKSYSQISENSKDRVASLQVMIQDLEIRVRDKAAESDAYMKQEEERLTVVTEERDQLTSEVARLKNELHLANELIVDIRTSNGTTDMSRVSPTAAIAMRSQSYGKTWTEMFAEKYQLEADIRELNEKNARLEDTMEAIISEVQAKAPLFNQLATDNDHLRQDYEKICDEHLTLRSEYQQLSANVKNLHSANQTLTFDLKQAKQMNSDFAQQIAHLLSYNDAEDTDAVRSLVVQWLYGIQRQDEKQQSEAQVTLSKHFVIHNQVMTLVKRNEQLISLARKLTSEVEEYEAQLTLLNGKRVSDILQELNACQITITNLEQKLQPVLNEPLMNSNISHHTTDTQQQQHNNTSRFEQMYTELRAHNEMYLKEAKIDRDKLYADLDRAREDTNKYRVELARVQIQLQYYQDQLEINKRLDSQTHHDKTRLEEQVTQYQTLLTELQGQQNELRSEMIELRTRNEDITSKEANLEAERDLHKFVCENLRGQLLSLEQVTAQNERALSIASNAQETIEQTSKEEKVRLNGQIDRLDADLTVTKRKLEEAVQYSQTLTAKYELERSKMQERVDEGRAHSAALESSLKDANIKLDAVVANEQRLRQDLDILRQNQLDGFTKNSLDASDNTSVNNGMTGSAVLKLLKQDLKAERQRLADLQREFNALKEKEQMSDRALAELTESYQTLQRNAQLREQQLTDLATTHLQEAQTLNASLMGMQDNLQKMEIEHSMQKTTFNDQLSELLVKLTTAEAIIASTSDVQTQLRDAVEQEKQLREEAVRSYNEEVMKHAKAIERSKPLHDELATLRAAHDDLKRLRDVSQRQVEEKSKMLEVAQSAWEEEKRTLSAHMDELQKQNDSLSSLYTGLSNKLSEVHASEVRFGNFAVDSSEMRHLNELINSLRSQLDQERFLVRTEKQLLKAKSEELDMVRQQLLDAKARLDAERRRHDAQIPLMQVAEMQSRLRQFESTLQEVEILRQEKRRMSTETEELRSELDEATHDRDTYREELSDARIKVESYEGRIQQLMSSLEATRKRHQDILERYQRIDPVEHEQLKARLQQLESLQETMQAQVIAAEASVTRMREERSTLILESNSRIEKGKQSIRELRTEISVLQRELLASQSTVSIEKEAHLGQLSERTNTLENEVNTLRAQLSAAPSAETIKALEAQRNAAQQEHQVLSERHKKLLDSARRIQEVAKRKETKLTEDLEALQNAQQSQSDVSKAELDTLREQVKKLEQEKRLLDMRLSVFKGQPSKRPREEAPPSNSDAQNRNAALPNVPSVQQVKRARVETNPSQLQQLIPPVINTISSSPSLPLISKQQAQSPSVVVPLSITTFTTSQATESPVVIGQTPSSSAVTDLTTREMLEATPIVRQPIEETPQAQETHSLELEAAEIDQTSLTSITDQPAITLTPQRDEYAQYNDSIGAGTESNAMSLMSSRTSSFLDLSMISASESNIHDEMTTKEEKADLNSAMISEPDFTFTPTPTLSVTEYATDSISDQEFTTSQSDKTSTLLSDMIDNNQPESANIMYQQVDQDKDVYKEEEGIIVEGRQPQEKEEGEKPEEGESSIPAITTVRPSSFILSLNSLSESATESDQMNTSGNSSSYSAQMLARPQIQKIVWEPPKRGNKDALSTSVMSTPSKPGSTTTVTAVVTIGSSGSANSITQLSPIPPLLPQQQPLPLTPSQQPQQSPQPLMQHQLQQLQQQQQQTPPPPPQQQHVLRTRSQRAVAQHGSNSGAAAKLLPIIPNAGRGRGGGTSGGGAGRGSRGGGSGGGRGGRGNAARQ